MNMAFRAPPNVLVFSGSDPSGGAGMQADLAAINALGAHALTVPTALTVQDNVSVFAVHPVDAELVRHQAQVLVDRFQVDAVKLGIAGNRANAEVIAAIIAALRQRNPSLPVVFDPVLANGKGDALSADNAIAALEPLYAQASVITPNLNEADRLCGAQHDPARQAALLQARGCPHVLLKGGHGPQQQDVVNRWYGPDGAFDSWQWPRLPGEFHGSGCTLAAALAARLAHGDGMRDAIAAAQTYCQRTLETAYSIAAGQLIPNRVIPFLAGHS
ncbi:MAG TPA: hydroxymethylpyrimidine/phosphomethylpyrimidine kinase [Herbaspirillum sp.]